MTTVTSLLLIALLGSSCSSLQKQSNTTKSPLSSEKSTLHKRTPNFVDLEVPVDQVWFGCEGRDVKEDVAFLGFYVFDGENLWDFLL